MSRNKSNLMRKRITLDTEEVYYTIRLSARAKRVSLTMRPDGTLHVTLPKRAKEHDAERFMRQSKAWVLKRLKEHENSTALLIPNIPKRQRALYLDYAKLYIQKKLIEINRVYHFSYNAVRVIDQSSQWGSASSQNNLNFNYKLIFLPEDLAHYVIAHELCHLGEMNHGKAFWKLLEKAVKSPRDRDRELSRYHLV